MAAADSEEWLELVERLDAWADSAVADGDDIRVTLVGGRVMTLVVVDDDLDMLRVAFGRVEHVADYLTEQLAAMPEDCDHLVYTQYDVGPSSSRANPEPPEPPMPKVPPGTTGGWYA